MPDAQIRAGYVLTCVAKFDGRAGRLKHFADPGFKCLPIPRWRHRRTGVLKLRAIKRRARGRPVRTWGLLWPIAAYGVLECPSKTLEVIRTHAGQRNKVTRGERLIPHNDDGLPHP